MKKLAIIMLVLLIPSISFASWTISVTQDPEREWKSGQRMYVFKISVTSDASSSGDVTLSTYLTTTYGSKESKRIMNLIRGGLVYCLKYDPGSAAPTSAATITLDDETGWVFLTETVATAGTPEGFDGGVDTDFLVPITEIVFASTTLANGKTADFYIWILK